MRVAQRRCRCSPRLGRGALLRACALRTAWAAEAAAAPAGSPDVAAKATAVDVAHELQTSNLARTRGGTQPGWV